MAEKRVTVKDNFIKVKAFLEANGADTALVEFIEKRLEQTEKKNGARKPTANQLENEMLKVKILEIIANEGKTVTEITTELAASGMGVFTNQKISALANQLVDAEKVEKIKDKKRSLFKAVVG